MTANAEAVLDRLRAQRGIQKLKFRKDCIWHKCQYDRDHGSIKHQCAHPDLLNLVTGEPSHPLDNRKNETLCGRAARHYEVRIKRAEAA